MPTDKKQNRADTADSALLTHLRAFATSHTPHIPTDQIAVESLIEDILQGLVHPGDDGDPAKMAVCLDTNGDLIAADSVSHFPYSLRERLVKPRVLVPDFAKKLRADPLGTLKMFSTMDHPALPKKAATPILPSQPKSTREAYEDMMAKRMLKKTSSSQTSLS